MNWQLGADHDVDRAAAGHRHRSGSGGSSAEAYEEARERVAHRQRRLPGEPVGRPGGPGLRERGAATAERFAGLSRAVPRGAAAGPEARGHSTSRSSRCCPRSPPRSCWRPGRRIRRRRLAVDGRARSPSCCTSTCSSHRSSSCRRCSTPTSRPGSRSTASASCCRPRSLTPERDGPGPARAAARVEIRFEDVRFAYPSAERRGPPRRRPDDRAGRDGRHRGRDRRRASRRSRSSSPATTT